MTILPFPDRRSVQELSASLRKAREDMIVHTYTGEGRALADLCAPVVEPFRQCEPDLEQHLKGAFLRWQMGEIRATHENDPVAVGLALAVIIETFTMRMDELQCPYDSPGGGQAA